MGQHNISGVHVSTYGIRVNSVLFEGLSVHIRLRRDLLECGSTLTRLGVIVIAQSLSNTLCIIRLDQRAKSRGSPLVTTIWDSYFSILNDQHALGSGSLTLFRRETRFDTANTLYGGDKDQICTRGRIFMVTPTIFGSREEKVSVIKCVRD
jgi:hypothetical protein